jgi:hypothetical protein
VATLQSLVGALAVEVHELERREQAAHEVARARRITPRGERLQAAPKRQLHEALAVAGARIQIDAARERGPTVHRPLPQARHQCCGLADGARVRARKRAPCGERGLCDGDEQLAIHSSLQARTQKPHARVSERGALARWHRQP